MKKVSLCMDRSEASVDGKQFFLKKVVVSSIHSKLLKNTAAAHRQCSLCHMSSRTFIYSLQKQIEANSSESFRSCVCRLCLPLVSDVVSCIHISSSSEAFALESEKELQQTDRRKY